MKQSAVSRYFAELGRRGGKAANAKRSKEERRRIASLGGRASVERVKRLAQEEGRA